MTQMKRKKSNFLLDAPKWVVRTVLFAFLIGLWLVAMIGPFSFYDAAVERNNSASAKENLLSRQINVQPIKKEEKIADSVEENDLEEARKADSRNDDTEPVENENDDEGHEEDEDAESDDENGGDEGNEDSDDDEAGTEDEEEEENQDGVVERRLSVRRRVGDNGASELSSKRFIMEIAGLAGEDGKESTETAKVIIETRPAWAPIGAAHFEELVQNGFYDQCRFFRVVPGFIIQFGIAASPQVQKKWNEVILQDDPVVQSNKEGTLTFATAGPNTRTTQLFFNLKNNKFLDKQGFSPFAEVVRGMEFIGLINPEYRERPDQNQMQDKGNEYLDKRFPNLSYIVTIYEENQIKGGN